MALRDLRNTEMVALTRTWVEPGHPDHGILLARPVMAALLPEITAAHEAVRATLPDPDAVQRLEEIRTEQAELDARHDDLMRAIWFRCLSEEHIAREPDAKSWYRDLRDLIVPHGLQMVRSSYREEVGHGEMVAARLTRDIEQRLRGLSTHAGTLLEVTREWLSMADELGKLDHERGGLAPDGARSRRQETAVARSRWVRIVDLVLRHAEIVSGNGDPELDELVGRIAGADERAVRRRGQRGSATQPGEPEPADPPDLAGPGDGNAPPALDAGAPATVDTGSSDTGVAAAGSR